MTHWPRMAWASTSREGCSHPSLQPSACGWHGAFPTMETAAGSLLTIKLGMIQEKREAIKWNHFFQWCSDHQASSQVLWTGWSISTRVHSNREYIQNPRTHEHWWYSWSWYCCAPSICCCWNLQGVDGGAVREGGGNCYCTKLGHHEQLILNDCFCPSLFCFLLMLLHKLDYI